MKKISEHLDTSNYSQIEGDELCSPFRDARYPLFSKRIKKL